jgi:hypothetical protein
MRRRHPPPGPAAPLIALSISLGLAGASAHAARVVQVSVAYYDTEHASPTTPNPWLGSPNTTFFGSPDVNGIFDTGAILLANLGPGDALVGQGLKVDGFANNASFRLWDANIGAAGFLLHPGQNVIFAQQGSGTFDTSDQPIINDPTQRTNNHPVVHLTIDGAAYNFVDTTQVLNTGGFDPGDAFQRSESLPWTPIGTVPEPAVGGLIGAVAACALRRPRGGRRRSRAPRPRPATDLADFSL